ncbi:MULTISPECIES: TetR/AcrR family transcriptional regulator [Stappiaceae]|uniref:TetR/AcrR family transcriptional regulator n=1 Tax=Stappiaceae TaxID=2821832 RepID=UPI001268E21E|nr:MULTISPECIES: TetR/AcrR family transcriptional regulator [Stappiaceae]MBN8179932.1 TetR/AcrR family transcriptional regulator [Roseibium aggregatum]QFT01171.1 HTH-type transcriptional regulator LuxR [Labrenzia sp. THAF191b]QFT07484.1 HTH-type transcriptional regulator LuxR [Labrenzia sp. THAF191a]QFT19028.1 HTH-type transcriptional regulator LuxR [Labrenzia sp. THAF187b]UES45898.1 TetR family transcriptional regulator [Roseibium aggregatum]
MNGMTDVAETGDTSSRRRLPPSERRQQIVEGAVAFFAEVGLDGNTRDLAKRIGVTQSLLFNYFATKDDLIEAVYEKVYLGRLSPDWPERLTDREVPLRRRLLDFYTEYSTLIFQYEWMRIFMFSGLYGAELNRRYLKHLGDVILLPLLGEIEHEANSGVTPVMEDIWNLHGGIVYIGIRQHIYRTPCPDDPSEAISRAIDRFLLSFGISPCP